jgi:hypothetical protein
MVENLPLGKHWMFGDGSAGPLNLADGDVLYPGSYERITILSGATVRVANAFDLQRTPVVLCLGTFYSDGVIDLSGGDADGRLAYIAPGDQYPWARDGGLNLGYDGAGGVGLYGTDVFLTGAISDTDTTIVFIYGLRFNGEYWIRIDDEYLIVAPLVDNNVPNVRTVTRGAFGSTPAPHADGAVVLEPFPEGASSSPLRSGSGGLSSMAPNTGGMHPIPGAASRVDTTMKQPIRLMAGMTVSESGAGAGSGDGTNYGGAAGTVGNHFVLCAPRIDLGPNHSFNLQGGNGGDGGDDGTGLTGNGDCGGGGGGAGGWCMMIYDDFYNPAVSTGTGGLGGHGCGSGGDGSPGEAGSLIYMIRNW